MKVTFEKEFKEFSQSIVITSWAITIVWITLSFILAFFNKDTNSEVTCKLIDQSFGTTIAYFVYQASLKISRNISHVDRNGIPYTVKQKLDGIISEESEECHGDN